MKSQTVLRCEYCELCSTDHAAMWKHNGSPVPKAKFKKDRAYKLSIGPFKVKCTILEGPKVIPALDLATKEIGHDLEYGIKFSFWIFSKTLKIRQKELGDLTAGITPEKIIQHG